MVSYGKYRVKSVEKAMKLLKLYSFKNHELNLSQLSNELKIHKSTAYRLATTLAEGGFLHWDPQKGTYSLGLRLMEFSSILMSSMELRVVARPHLEKLRQVTGITVHLGVLDQGEVVYIDKLEGDGGLRLYSEIGKRTLCHCTALGKALLADTSESKVRHILEEKGMPFRTENTITSIPQFLTHLKQVREDGYALDNEEHERLVHCVAAPIRDYTGSIVAALSATLITKLLVKEDLNVYIAMVKEAGAKLSEELGYSVIESDGATKA